MYHFFPFLAKYGVFFFLLLVFLFVMIEIKVIGYALEKVGIDHRYVFIILFLSFFGSAINIPVARIPGETITLEEPVHYFGMQIVVPAWATTKETIVAVNLGGAIIPVVVSLYLLLKISRPLRALTAVAIVTAVSYHFATPIRGVGIAIPTFIPPIAAAMSALILMRKEAPRIAYIAGSVGTLLGADILNLGKISSLGSPFVSIGGAGTFDGIFFSSIIAVLLV